MRKNENIKKEGEKKSEKVSVRKNENMKKEEKKQEKASVRNDEKLIMENIR